MNSPSPISSDTFSLQCTRHDSRLWVRFSGTGDMAAIDGLATYTKQIHEAALREGVTAVAFDIRELDFLNSSCIKVLISWVYQVRSLSQPYTIRFETDGSLPWQPRCVAALKRLAPTVVVVNVNLSRLQ